MDNSDPGVTITGNTVVSIVKYQNGKAVDQLVRVDYFVRINIFMNGEPSKC